MVKLSRQEAFAELGVAEAAGDEEVRAAYKKLAREWHPDKNHAVEATERFQRINAAYHRLTQEDDAGYDELAEQDIFDFFEAIFREISRKGGRGGGGGCPCGKPGCADGGPFGLGGVIFMFGSARGGRGGGFEDEDGEGSVGEDDSDDEEGAFYERCSQLCPLPHPIFPVLLNCGISINMIILNFNSAQTQSRRTD